MRKMLVAAFAASLAVSFVPAAHAAVSSTTYRVQLDGLPPKGDSWAFLRYFPNAVSVHQGDVIQARWAGAGTPHTATMVPAGDANAWRKQNQDPGDPYALIVPDSVAGGDDAESVINPAALAPPNPPCGASAAAACSFDGTKVVNSGLRFSDPSNEPSFSVKMDAPVGTYTFLCLVHPGMQMTVHVVPKGQAVPPPSIVRARGLIQFAVATSIWGEQADAQSQRVVSGPIDGGHSSFTMWAGGFSHNVSANEYPTRGITMHVGDKLQVLGDFEIHTATLPKSSFATVPFITTQCEVPGPDTPATSPTDCADPTKFQVAFNATAVAPTSSTALSDPAAFVNSGLLSAPSSTTFVAEQPGTYTVVCLVHGPSMSTTIKVVG